jgi:hypothetical protein
MKNGKLHALFALVMGVSLVATVSAWAAIEAVPKPITDFKNPTGEIFSANGDVIYTKEGVRSDTTWIRIHDDTRCDATGSPTSGGQGTGLALGYATWCWERGLITPGVYDSCSSTTAYGAGRPGCFKHFDVYTLLTNQWHLDTLDAYHPSPGVEDSTPWCGEYGDTLIWENPYGYGPQYNWSLILNLGKTAGGFNAGTGFTIGGVHMYDCELNYDYCYLEYALSNNETTAVWTQMARYNATSNPEPVGSCPGTGGGRYGCAQYTSFQAIKYPGVNNSTLNLLVRWRFASDSAWDDEDASGGVWTDGAWRIDHIYAKGQNSGGYNSYYPADPNRTAVQTFESGLGTEWTKPSLPQAELGGYWSGGKWVHGVPKLVDWWHLELNPDYANRGNTCEYSNNWMWVADDQANSQNQEDEYHYRLTTPVFECGNNNPYYDPDGLGPGPDNRWTGVIVETDEYLCIKDIVGDVTDTQCRTYDASINRWSQWRGDNYVTVGGCQFWNIDQLEEWTQYLGSSIDSIQFSWEFLDRCDYNASSELPCMGQHRKATYIIDNVSVGVFEQRGTIWAQGASERFSDTFARDMPMHAMFCENWELFPANPFEQEDSMTVQVRDVDGVMGGPPPLNSGVKIHWRISTTCGASWDKETSRPMGATAFPSVAWNEKTFNFSVPDDIDNQGTKAEFNGVYSTMILAADNATYLGGSSIWPEGTVIEYFFTARDSLGNRDTVPNRMAASRNDPTLVRTGTGQNFDRRLGWPFNVKVLPCPVAKDPLPVGQRHPVLVVDGYGRAVYDIDADRDFAQTGAMVFPAEYQVVTESLKRLGIQYDFYRDSYGVSRSSAPIYSQPLDHDGYGGVLDHAAPTLARRYKTVIWFTGEFNRWTLPDSSQLEIATYIDKDGVNFPDSANIWILGEDLCEDEENTDPAWVDGLGHQTTNGAYFWTTLAGLTQVTGGCTDDDGHGSATEPYRYYLIGQAGTCLSGITKGQGYWDCPVRGHPDDAATVSSATPIMKYSDALGATQFCTALKRHPNGSKVVLSFVPLSKHTTAQERDCVTQAILGASAFNTGIPTPKASCTINTDVPGAVPSLFALRQNVPNPFNPSTTIRFDLPDRTKTTLRIYDIAGREICTLLDGTLNAGEHSATWNGRDGSGHEVGSGVYFYRLDAGKNTATRKMVMLR